MFNLYFQESRGKRPFKIWDGFRNIRKSLVASSLKDLEIRGKYYNLN